MAIFSTREVLVEDEGSFCENAGSASANTYTTRLPVKDATFELTQERLPDGTIQSRQNERHPGFLGTRECTVTLVFPLYGHNSAEAGGGLTNTELSDLLGDGLGGKDATGTGPSLGGSATASDLDAAAGTTAGLVYLVGAKSDGKADGQACVASDGNGTLLTALPGVPVTGDAVNACLVAYPKETAGTTKRFLLGFADQAGAQYHAMGCQLSGIAISTPVGGEPEITLTYRGAYWDQGLETIPHGVSMPNDNWAIVSGGSMFFQTVGTATRATVTPSTVEFSLDIGLSPKTGTGGVGTYQHILGWERTMARPSVTLTVPWVDTYKTLFDTDGSDSTHKHLLFTCSPTAGRAVGWYMPRAYIAGSRPTFTDNEGLLYQTFTMEGREGTTTTNDLTRSAFRIFMG